MKFLLRILLSLFVATTAVVASHEQLQQQQQRHNTSPSKHCAPRGQSCRSTPCCSGFQCDSKDRICKLKSSDRCSRSSDCCSPNTCQSGYCRPPKTTPPSPPQTRCGRSLGQSCSTTSKTSCCKTGTCSGGKCCLSTGVRGCRSKSDCCSYGDICDSGVCKKKGSGGPINPQPQCSAGLGQTCKSGFSKTPCCKVGTCGARDKCCLNTGSSGCSLDSHCCNNGDKCESGVCKKKNGGPTEPQCTAVLGDRCRSSIISGLPLSSSTTPSCCKVGTCGTKSTCCLNTESSGCTSDSHCCKDGDKCTGGICKTPVTPPVCSDLRGSCSNGGCCTGTLTCGTSGTCCLNSNNPGCGTKADCCNASDDCIDNVCKPPPQCSALNGRCSDIPSTGSCCQTGLTCFQSRCCVDTTKSGCTESSDCCTSSDICTEGVCTAPPQCSDLNGRCSDPPTPGNCCRNGLTCSNSRCCINTLDRGCTESLDCCNSDDTCTVEGVCTAPPVCGDVGATCAGGECCKSGLRCAARAKTCQPECTTGPLQCCYRLVKAEEPIAAVLIFNLGIVVTDPTTMVGLTCSPIGSDSRCEIETLCCENNNFNGRIALGCTRAIA